MEQSISVAVLDLYDGGCEYLEGSNYDIGRLKKDIEILVYVESPNKHVGKNTIDNCLKLRANFKGKEFKKIDKDMLRITGTTTGIEILSVEKPEQEE